MKKLFFGVVLTSVLVVPVSFVSAAEGVSTHVEESRAVVKQLHANLKMALVAGMKEGGPTAAIAACNVQAQPITAAASSRRTGLHVGRTSMRLRNSENAPDAWEIRVLEQFEARSSAGEALSTMEYHEVVEQKGDKVFRYMKAIPAGKPCMVCHGELIATDVLKKIRVLYPLDQATGFKPGDLRGAFTISQRLD